ncbi:MAG: hypothetical protein QOG64_1442 [Acidimicrobiaceae bacterium]|nr:hypothetical protein [Acidimicrobiaceae bacterium]
MARADVVSAFLAGAAVVSSAIASPEVGEQWSGLSVLEDQSVGSLAGHLARGGVWVVGEYLSAGEPDEEVTYDSAGAYYAGLVERSGPDDHHAIRKRGAAIAAAGHTAVVAELSQRMDVLRGVLADTPPTRRVAVIGGAVIHLGDYLCTRIVEQVVHLDDLVRSVGRRWTMNAECIDIAIDVGVDVARRRAGDDAVVRALYRRGFADVLPVL